MISQKRYMLNYRCQQHIAHDLVAPGPAGRERGAELLDGAGPQRHRGGRDGDVHLVDQGRTQHLQSRPQIQHYGMYIVSMHFTVFN